MRMNQISFLTPGPAYARAGLAGELREKTASLHKQVEDLLGLPDSIRTRVEYENWLSRFLGLYEPLERSLAGFTVWEVAGFELPKPSQSACLAADLATLGIHPGHILRAPARLLPRLSTFAHTVGMFYVLQGARLGGRVILRDLETRIGSELKGATRFFGGHGDHALPSWQDVRVALDDFGREHPQHRDLVVDGAQGTFRAMLAWFVPFCTAAPQS